MIVETLKVVIVYSGVMNSVWFDPEPGTTLLQYYCQTLEPAINYLLESVRLYNKLLQYIAILTQIVKVVLILSHSKVFYCVELTVNIQK